MGVSVEMSPWHGWLGDGRTADSSCVLGGCGWVFLGKGKLAEAEAKTEVS